MGDRRGELQDVELVEVDAAELGAPAPARGADGVPPVPRRARDPRRRRRALAAVGLVVAAVVASSAVTTARENARLARLADLPGFLTPINGPMTVRWRADGSTFGGMSAFDGTLLGASFGEGGAAEVVALDPRTGAERWRTEIRAAGVDDSWPGCSFPSEPGDLGDLGDLPGSALPAIVCVVVDESVPTGTIENGQSLVPVRAHLTVLDPTTGAVLDERPTYATAGVAPLGTDIVLTHIDDAGHLQAERLDPLGGQPRWTFRTPDPVSMDDFGYPQGWTTTAEGLVVVRAPAEIDPAVGTWRELAWVLSPDGEVLRSPEPTAAPQADWTEALAGGALIGEHLSTTTGAVATRIVEVTTGRTFTIDGYPVAAGPDDGSLPGLLLAMTENDRSLRAYDLATGEPAWTSSRSGGNDLTRSGSTSTPVALDGRLIQIESKALTAIDGRTGETVWSTPLERPPDSYGGNAATGQLATDGRLILLSEPDPDGGAALVAYAVADGRRLWAADLPGDLYLLPIGGALYGWSGSGVVALG
ncbi:outer membrane protein assembly factor BamB family protein [Pengzhenrongella sicca]|uniref:PQQ-binding-like beta-propeller repeat protein n=1 Tax=Pengzhenrongella sicca TaxID=2819238 RepID=A0A8A4ZI27_9MICO|nr:PQQ-binding-like beta-propeller repeat protein [Pengzhenrongella sicca]QTE29278.1 PQQ-binding-like beta-propeller repeat protein [Pengzhenrongella sicca]